MDKKLLYLICSVFSFFTLINLWWEIVPNRYLRLFTILVFAGFLFRRITQNSRLIFFFVALPLLALSDISFLAWEATFSKFLYYSLHSLAIVCIICSTTSKIKKLRFSLFDKAFLLSIFLTLTWILYTFGAYFSAANKELFLSIVFYLNGGVVVFSVFVSFFFSANLVEKNSTYFFLAVLGFALSDLLLFSIYNMGSSGLRYIDNLFYIFGLSFLSRFILEETGVKEIEAGVENKELPRKSLRHLKTYS